jgi:hypothetical protein
VIIGRTASHFRRVHGGRDGQNAAERHRLCRKSSPGCPHCSKLSTPLGSCGQPAPRGPQDPDPSGSADRLDLGTPPGEGGGRARAEFGATRISAAPATRRHPHLAQPASRRHPYLRATRVSTPPATRDPAPSASRGTGNPRHPCLRTTRISHQPRLGATGNPAPPLPPRHPRPGTTRTGVHRSGENIPERTRRVHSGPPSTVTVPTTESLRPCAPDHTSEWPRATPVSGPSQRGTRR